MRPSNLRSAARLLGLLTPPTLVTAWLVTAGSYAWWRDAIVIGGITLAVILSVRRRIQARASLSDSPPFETFLSALTIRTAFLWGLSCWIAASAADIAFRPSALILRGTVAGPPAKREALASLRIGLAMSGGGYRAALVHAGVLQELAALGIPVTNIASVSGGSIIAAFVAHGGDPADFVEAVKSGRFRFKRELLSAFALPHWILPFGSFTRRDVQAGVVRRLLVAHLPGTAPRPALMLATTDLRHGLSVGVTTEGLMMTGPTTDRFFRFHEAVEVDGLSDLADVVALSGAFPGAFPALQTSARLTMVREPLPRSSDSRMVPLALLDGGVRDNLGLRLLQGIDQEARGTGHTSLPWPGFKPAPHWALDLIFVSDGGQSFERVDARLGLLGQIFRAIDVSGLETGILRPVMQSAELHIVALSIAAEIGLAPDAMIVQSSKRPRSEVRRDYFPPRQPHDPSLTRLVEVVPRRDLAREALAAYARTRGSVPMNVSDLDKRCQEPANRDAPECHWRTFADIVLDDVDHVAAIFRRSATLEDQYSAGDADALVRLGRYFVILKLSEIEEKLAMKTGRRSP